MSDPFGDIRLRDLEFFDRLAVLGSLSKTAKILRIPKATASRWLTQIEDRIGHPLVKRTTRSFRLTDRGRELADHVRSILATVREAQAALSDSLPGGRLRVALPVSLGRVLAGPVIAEFRRDYPTVSLEISLSEGAGARRRDRYDLLIRAGRLADSALIARPIAHASMWLYAGTRFREADLTSVPLLVVPGDERLLARSSLAFGGAPGVLVDDRTALADALICGAGAGLLPSFLGEPARGDGSLVRLRQEPVASLPINALYDRAQRADVRLQAFIDHCRRHLEAILASPESADQANQ